MPTHPPSSSFSLLLMPTHPPSSSFSLTHHHTTSLPTPTATTGAYLLLRRPAHGLPLLPGESPLPRPPPSTSRRRIQPRPQRRLAVGHARSPSSRTYPASDPRDPVPTNSRVSTSASLLPHPPSHLPVQSSRNSGSKPQPLLPSVERPWRPSPPLRRAAMAPLPSPVATGCWI
ncbi:hypothetical protein ACQJBY_036257 [Aegilops geniculata]